ncbi:amino acid--[acyl-carrier-protein] ligase [Microbacterium horticulturae]|uniref:Amino acid--[acyl-carrier-protein] ligase n=1 Tax=Microbacterium horticulturae TaxID=3028316 RepID=A0ABY8C1Q1_9MICO|nr:amino acid--[acyl-carrier-protein] ligase [Microbacterium sp. KACC 23027]WEG09180.1 amino acid--[acyl-carrier-protein] ligase [Microbacterium sp. KACC 23027]
MDHGRELVETEQSVFRAALIDAGLLVDAGVDGLYQRSGAFERVVRGIEAHASRAAAGEGGAQYYFPPLLPRADFEHTGYLRSFPNLLGAIEVFKGGDAEHAELLKAVDGGEDWTARLTPSDITLSSAACHALYPHVPLRIPGSGLRYEVQGYCFRHEPSLDPARMQSFRMHEFVYIGEASAALEHRDRWLQRGLTALSDLGLDVTSEEANDPFFGRAGRMLAANQRATALKFEITCPVSSQDQRTAIASANYHEAHFGEEFGLTTETGGTAHSACFGFGLERIALALFSRHGVASESWPESVRAALWP